jgi:hypothetical protein
VLQVEHLVAEAARVLVKPITSAKSCLHEITKHPKTQRRTIIKVFRCLTKAIDLLTLLMQAKMLGYLPPSVSESDIGADAAKHAGFSREFAGIVMAWKPAAATG